MPTLGAPLECAKLELRNPRAHQLGAAPSSPVAGQFYFNTGDSTLYWWDGSAWIPAKAGTATGAAGGDLSGTYPNPQIAAGVIVDADVAPANKDGAVGTPSLRTIGTGAQQAMAGNTRLDTIAAPTGAVSINSQKLTAVADPTAATDGANKQYVDNLVQGLDAHQSVKAATTANIANLAGGAPNTLDSIALAANDRVLVKDQTTQSQNGIYIVQTLGTGANGTWVRATDMDAWAEVPSAYVWVEQGTVNADSGWLSTADAGGTLGSTAITWTQFSGAGQITAGAGLTKTGNTIDVAAGTGITTSGDVVAVNSAIIPRYYSSATHGAGNTITITQATHGCRASRGLIVQVQDEATGAVELPDVVVAASGDVTVTYAAAVTANSKRVTVIG